jgi:hypothetical protein
MPPLHALLVGGALLTVALVVMTARDLSTMRRVAVALLVAALTAAAWVLYTRRAFDLPLFTAAAAAHFGALSLLAALLPRSRRGETPTMPAEMLVVRITLGVFLLILAVIGGLVPVLQGWVFFLLALLVFFPKAKFTEKVLVKAEPKVPRVVAFLRRMGIGHR